MEDNFGSVGSRDWQLPCTCGHLKREHAMEPYAFLVGIHGEDSYCVGKGCYGNRVHKFILDNLSYVEQVARARGLV